MVTPKEIIEDLKKVKYPGYTRDIVSFGIVRNVEIGTEVVTVALAPGGAKPEVVRQITAEITERVRQLTGIDKVEVDAQLPDQPPRREPSGRADIPGVRHVVAVASGKGGVGKSTVAVNLALALHGLGQRVGLLDADVYGPSVALMLGLTEPPTGGENDRITPVERFGIKAISLGLFIHKGQPVIWRGPMITKLLTQFLHDVDWGELDVLVIDLPPGTGDAQLTIAQQVPLSGGVIVTTPQDVALLDVQRGIAMFNQVNTPVLGLIENMSYHICDHCGHRSEIFGHGGGAKMAEESGIPLLGEIPLVRAIREAADQGHPIAVSQPQSPQSEAFSNLARQLAAQLEDSRRIPVPVVH